MTAHEEKKCVLRLYRLLCAGKASSQLPQEVHALLYPPCLPPSFVGSSIDVLGWQQTLGRPADFICCALSQDSLKRLPEELRAQEANAARVDTFLTRARPHWGCDRKGMLYAYLQQCILPRVTYSPPDAAFCAKFTQRLHELAVPFFPTILYFDTVSSLLSTLLLPLLFQSPYSLSCVVSSVSPVHECDHGCSPKGCGLWLCQRVGQSPFEC